MLLHPNKVNIFDLENIKGRSVLTGRAFFVSEIYDRK
ncbi:hypothetical protein EV200_102336 [Pedobacter psychrotolerans]|uniref:Uncharacterized protein n=1 Tax=Pedobacter psychrotolerans TaxID=1843235 RepID=A0A4R2HKC4_9SPHI|nr:hypothetical protein EV200_102336 [Pedobacter psychrotolerans]